MTASGVQFKSLPGMTVVEATIEVPDYSAVESCLMHEGFDAFFEALDAAGIPTDRAISRVDALPGGGRGARIRLGVVVEPGTAAPDGFEIAEVPPVPMAITIEHRGPLVGLDKPWQELILSMDRRPDLTKYGTESREYHAHAPWEDTSQESWITEIQLPMRPVGPEDPPR